MQTTDIRKIGEEMRSESQSSRPPPTRRNEWIGQQARIESRLKMLSGTTVDTALLLVIAPFVGSFIGVVIVRLPEGRSVIVGRSACPQCSHVLAAIDLVPIASWLVRRARCRYCGGRIAPLYPAIELAALVIAGWSLAALPGWLAIASCAFGWILLALAVIDRRDFLLPDPLVLLLAMLGLFVTWLVDPDRLSAHLAGLLVGYLSFEAVNEIYRRLRRRDGLGHGDAKLLGAIGGWVGWEGLATVVVYATVAGLLESFVRNRWSDLRLETRIPFGPALCLGAWLVWLYGPLQVAGAGGS